MGFNHARVLYPSFMLSSSLWNAVVEGEFLFGLRGCVEDCPMQSGS